MNGKLPPQEIPQDQVAVLGRAAVAAVAAIIRRLAFKKLVCQLDDKLAGWIKKPSNKGEGVKYVKPNSFCLLL